MTWPNTKKTMKPESKKKPVSAQPAQSHQLQSAGCDPDEPQEADAAAASTTTGVKGGGETDSSGHDSKASASDGKPAAPPTTLTREQLEVANQFRAKRAQPNCPEVELGLDLIDIIRNNRLPVRGGVVRNSAALLGLSSIQVRELVELAREHRTQNGGKTCSPRTDIRPSGAGASKHPPAGPPEAAAGDERSAAPAPIPAPEKMSARTKKLKAAEAAASQAGEPLQDRALPPGETAIPDPAEPARASAEPVEPPAAVSSASVPDTGPAAVAVGKLNCLPPMLPTDLTEDDWASRINEGVGEGIRRFINVGSDLRAAKEALKHGRWIKMFESGRIKMSVRTAEMFMRVAAHDTLSNSQHLANLPPSLTTLYALAGGLVEVIETGIKDGKINPALTAKQAQDFVRAHCPRPGVKKAAKQCEADTPCPPSGTETADLPNSPTEAVMTGAGDTSDNPPPALTPTEAAPSQPEPAHDEASALSSSPEFDLANEWSHIEASLEAFLRRCPSDKQPDFWDKMHGFVCRHLELAPPDERKGTA